MKFKTVFIVALMATLWSTDSFSQECKPVTFDGYTYDVVQIGDQCWFAENLRTRRYANGDEIIGDLSDADWYWDFGAMAVYGEGESSREELLANLNTYGGLYNWYAVDDERGLCPSGWHVPTDGEYTELTDFLGGWLIAGTPMKSTYGWKDGGNGTNSSGFSALAGGYRNYRGSFDNGGDNGFFWSSSKSGADAWLRELMSGYSAVYRYNNDFRYGFSVRCLKDAE